MDEHEKAAPRGNGESAVTTIGDPERIGSVTAPSGTIVVLDGGLMWLWCHDLKPVLPEGTLSTPEDDEDANNGADLIVEGPDARAAGLAYDRSVHPLYRFDIPASAVQDAIDDFNGFAKNQGFKATTRALDQRISHRERIDLLLKSGEPAHGIQYHGIWAAVASGLPTDKKLPVYGRRRSAGTEFEGRWHDIWVEVVPGAKVVRSEPRGYVMVDEARLMFADTDALGAWRHEEPLDGLADFVFWGRDAEFAAREAGAPSIDGDNFGWTDLPVREAAERGTGVEELREQRGWAFATDFRPHSHHWQAMEQVRASDTESGTIQVGNADLCLFMTSWGDGLFDVFADFDESDRLVRVRVLLGSKQKLELMRQVQDRYFGEGAKLVLATKRLMEEGPCVRFMYREEPDHENDSGWRVFAGDEDEEYTDDANNIALVAIHELLEKEPELERLLHEPVGAVFERAGCDDEFVAVIDWSPPND